LSDYADVVWQIPTKVYITEIHQTITIECLAFITPKKCLAFNTTPVQRNSTMKIKWYHGETEVNNYRTDHLSENNITSRLRIVNVTREKAGIYQCVLTYISKNYRNGAVVIIPQNG